MIYEQSKQCLYNTICVKTFRMQNKDNAFSTVGVFPFKMGKCHF